MKTSVIFSTGAAVIPLLFGCASQPVAVSPVGPVPAGHGASFAEGSGYLQVFSDTEAHVIGDGPAYYPHTAYSIYDQSGKRVKYVPNHIGNMDETPTPVSITAGSYKVVAESSSYGRVTVPVIIQPGKTTSLHLDRGWRPAPSLDSNSIVRFPDGEAVGWNGSSRTLPE